MASAESSASDFHKLRILGKKLRYLLEFFAELNSCKATRRLIHDLKAVQDALGRYHDCFIHQVLILSMVKRQPGEKPFHEATLLGMGMLLQQLSLQQAVARQDFLRQFEHFEAGGNRKLYKHLFRRGQEA